jgi:multimeric flavodoxin WrbA
VCDKLVNRDIPLVNPNVLIVKADSNAPDFKVENGRTICLSDYKFTGCDSCKLCYQTKTCRFNDDFSKIEEEISKADIVVFTGTLNCGTYRGGMFKRLLDRGVKNGLAPLKAKERKSQAFGYLVTNIEDASKSQFKEWLVGDCAYSQKHFIGVESANEESLNRMIDFAKILLDGKVMPQINGYSEKHGRYFADLSLSIPTILPQEKEYFESLGTFEPIMADAHSRPTADVKEYKKSAHGRTTPYRMYSGALKTLKTIE